VYNSRAEEAGSGEDFVTRLVNCLALAAALALSSSVPAAALEQEPSAPSTNHPAEPAPPTEQVAAPSLDDAQNKIVVTGRKEGQSLHDYVNKFVDQVGDTAPERGYARFEGAVCIGVESLPNPSLQYLVDRVSEVALDVGLKPGKPGCRPSIVIILVADGKALASLMIPPSLRNSRLVLNRHGRPAFEWFATSDAPVRWWQASVPMNELSQTGVGHAYLGSRIRSAFHDSLLTTYVVVDVRKLHGVTLTQLADYVAMVSLVQIDPDANTASYDTILNLFTAGMPPAGLTDWDKSYLSTLYRIELFSVPEAQKGNLVSLMTRDQKRAGEE
jgi:hypothetical protein